MLPLSLNGQIKVKVEVAQSCPALCDPMDCTVHGILQARILEWVAFPFSRVSSQPRDWTQVSHIAGGFFTGRAIGKSKNTGVGSLSLLQRIFPTQGSNPSLPHCRWILYQLSRKGSPPRYERLPKVTTYQLPVSINLIPSFIYSTHVNLLHVWLFLTWDCW